VGRDRVSEAAAAAELVRGRPPAQFSPKIRASRSVETLQLAFIDSLALTRRFMRRFQLFQVHELAFEDRIVSDVCCLSILVLDSRACAHAAWFDCSALIRLGYVSDWCFLLA
jgi:hypothetical protein